VWGSGSRGMGQAYADGPLSQAARSRCRGGRNTLHREHAAVFEMPGHRMGL
jgi:hypothetical protein